MSIVLSPKSATNRRRKQYTPKTIMRSVALVKIPLTVKSVHRKRKSRTLRKTRSI